MTAPLSHCHATTQIPAGGLAAVWTATPEEREAVRAALEILACDRLEVRYRIRVTGDGVWRLAGTLEKYAKLVGPANLGAVTHSGGVVWEPDPE